jgi:hypothetical protein
MFNPERIARVVHAVRELLGEISGEERIGYPVCDRAPEGARRAGASQNFPLRDAKPRVFGLNLLLNFQ